MTVIYSIISLIVTLVPALATLAAALFCMVKGHDVAFWVLLVASFFLWPSISFRSGGGNKDKKDGEVQGK